MEKTEVTANGLKFSALAEGPNNSPLALILHGFPDSPHTWRFLIPKLAEAGFRVVAPWLRGYAPTEIPKDGSYGAGALAADVNALHEALGADERAVLIGHDFGAIASYGAANLAPTRWSKLVTLAVPPLSSIGAKLFGYEQLKRSFYAFVFQTPIAEIAVGMNNMAFIGSLWRDWSPGYSASEDIVAAKEALSNPANLSAAIGYYRAMLGTTPPDPKYSAETAAGLGVAPQATLFIHGDQDGSTDSGTYADVDKFLSPGSKIEVVSGTGHFLHLEKPSIVNRLIIDWVA